VEADVITTCCCFADAAFSAKPSSRRKVPSLVLLVPADKVNADYDSQQSRRKWMRNVIRSTNTAALSVGFFAVPSSSASTMTTMTRSNTLVLSSSNSAAAKNDNDVDSWSSIRARIQETKDTLQKLLDNWEKAVIDCTYADVPRELLEQKNKELLLEKASTYALFDKSVSVVSCKTVVGTVRDYIGRTGIGPVVGLEKTLKASLNKLMQEDVLSFDEVETFVQLAEEAQRELTRADSLSYSARRDFSAMNNFDPSETARILADDSSNLELCRKAIVSAADKLNGILKILPKE